jgi:hypothetical protein
MSDTQSSRSQIGKASCLVACASLVATAISSGSGRKKFGGQGIIIPPLPPKQQMFKSDSAEFYETRRRGLENFLTKVSGHEQLGFYKHFILFLEADEDTLTAAMKDKHDEDIPAAPSSSYTARATTWMNTKTGARVS